MAINAVKPKNDYPIQHILNWYFGNYCTRKCFDNDTLLRDHYGKLMLFAEKNPNLKMTHKEFLSLFNKEMTICTLSPSFKKKLVSWKLFRIFQDTANYESDKIIVEGKRVKRFDGELEKPVIKCKICRALGTRW